MINREINIEEIRNQFKINKGNYVFIDNLFDRDFIKKCELEFINMKSDDFVKYNNPYFEYEKHTLNDVNKMPENLQKLFNYIHSEEFINFISHITDFDKLYIDDKRWGGGLHKTNPSGYLAMHKDFNVLPESYRDEHQMLRCINLIGYITDENTINLCGDLEFWDENCQFLNRINNSFNRWVLFDTRKNYHGQPYPYKGIKPRMSIASYYYIKTKIDSNIWKSTEYLKLPWMDESDEYIKSRDDRADSKKRYRDFL